MTDDGDGAVELSFNQFGYVARHQPIVHSVVPGGCTVVSKVNRKDSMRFAQRLGYPGPVAAHAKQAVQDHHAERPGTRLFEMELNSAQLADEN